jgi:hypothetical protein
MTEVEAASWLEDFQHLSDGDGEFFSAYRRRGSVRREGS